MAPRIALVHATALAIEPVADAFARLWPEARLMNVLDDSLSSDRTAAGALTPPMIARFGTLARYCVEHGADGILFTCSAFGPAIEAAGCVVPVPVLKPNAAMLDEALALAARGNGRLALLATFEASLESIAGELRAMAEARNQSIGLHSRHVTDAMTALGHGDASKHDALIAAAFETWHEARDCDALLLAQFSMARARDAVQARSPMSVLVSTDSAVMAMRQAMIATG
ncbi:MAG: aspartate/glutamate racemase family protein [Betaproteobacteria bacterium]